MASISFGKSGIILEYSCIDHSSGRNFEGSRNQGIPSLEPFASLLSSFRWRYGEPIDATPAALLCMVLRCAMSIRKEEISRSATSQTRSVSRVGRCYHVPTNELFRLYCDPVQSVARAWCVRRLKKPAMILRPIFLQVTALENRGRSSKCQSI